MTKILAFMLSFFVLTAQTKAAAGSNESLKEAFNDFNYSVSVEWDQQDQAAYHSEVNKFEAKILTLQNNGLTDRELLNFLIANIKDKNAAEDLKQFYEMISVQKLDSSEIQSMTQEILNRHYARGSSWVGGGLVIGAGVILVLAGVIAFKLWQIDWKSKHCSHDLVCNYGNCYTENEQCN